MPEQGYTLTANSVRRLNDMLRRFDMTPRGQAPQRRRRHTESAGGSGGGVACVVGAYVSGQFWLCDVYGAGLVDDDGNARTATIEDASIYLPNVNVAETGIVGDTIQATRIGGHYEAIAGSVWT